MIARLFGKLPAHGDFVCRGFARAECDAHDRWLSASLAHARVTHGDAFDSRYERALPWRFALDDGRGARAGGAVALSQDAAGRRFPVYLEVSSLPAAAPVAIAAMVEDLLYRAVGERWTADALAAAAAAIALSEGEKDGGETGRWWLEGMADVLTGDQPRDLVSRMLAAVPAEEPA